MEKQYPISLIKWFLEVSDFVYFVVVKLRETNLPLVAQNAMRWLQFQEQPGSKSTSLVGCLVDKSKRGRNRCQEAGQEFNILYHGGSKPGTLGV